MKKTAKRVRTGTRNARKPRAGRGQHTVSGAGAVSLHPKQSSAPTAQNRAEMEKEAQSLARVKKMMCETLGVEDPRLADQLLVQADALQVLGNFKTDRDKFMAAFAFMQEVKPAGATEALLAVQILGVHNTALRFLRLATVEGQTFEGTDANVLRATRLLRLFNEQLEAMAKLKGKAGQQKVTVEHVHIHQGGQAIVGAVSTTKVDQGEGGN